MKTMHPPDPAIVRGLLARLAPGDAELAAQHRSAVDPAFWLGLNPDLTISTELAIDWSSEQPPDARAIADAHARYESGPGYVLLDQMLAPRWVERMRLCVETLRRHDWPAVFSFVYDPFWSIGRTPALYQLLRALLGGEPRLLPRIWTHYVAPAAGNAGWQPHTDGQPGSPPTAAIWIPLSEATLSNGCMYVVARDEITRVIGEGFSGNTSFTAQQMHALLRGARACPARPGQILCWGESLIHWGAAYESGGPRLSLALEFIASPSQTPSGDRPPALDPRAPAPDLRVRLAAIGGALLRYRRFEPFLERFVPLATRLVAR